MYLFLCVPYSYEFHVIFFRNIVFMYKSVIQKLSMISLLLHERY